MRRVVFDGRVIQDRYHGIGRQTLELIRACAAQPEEDVEIVVLHGTAPDERLSARALDGLPRVRLERFDAPLTSAREQVAWPGLLRRLRADVLWCPYHVAAPVRSPIPVVATLHDCIFEDDARSAPSAAFRLAYRSWTAVTLRRATAIVTVSHATRRAVARHYGIRIPAANVVPNGVDPGFGGVSDARALERLGADGLPDRYVMHVGVRRPHKNQTTLVRAFARLAAEEPGLGLVLVGQPDRRFPDPVPGLVRALGLSDRVHLLPSVSDPALRALLQGAAVFAFPSRVEGFGLPVLEAMAAGTPVVASTADAVVEVAGPAALAVPPDDVAGWALALGRVVRDPDLASQLRERGRERVAAHPWSAAARAARDVMRRTWRPHAGGPRRTPSRGRAVR